MMLCKAQIIKTVRSGSIDKNYAELENVLKIVHWDALKIWNESYFCRQAWRSFAGACAWSILVVHYKKWQSIFLTVDVVSPAIAQGVQILDPRFHFLWFVNGEGNNPGHNNSYTVPLCACLQRAHGLLVPSVPSCIVVVAAVVHNSGWPLLFLILIVLRSGFFYGTSWEIG